VKEIGQGLAWMGFWIGLGLYNFQGCHTDINTAHDLKVAWDKGSKNE